MILGIDEVGRGPWAGPLVVGAVVLGGQTIDGLTDSKKLSKKRRDELNVLIREQAAGYALGWVTSQEIDEVGLSEALRLATRRAVEQIKTSYHEIIIDGTVNFLADTTKGQYVTTMKKADLLVPSVSAASIIAKVARDNYMAEQDVVYEGYKFGSHAGYGTAAHRAAIEKLGVTPLHRLSFAPLTKYRSKPLPSSQISVKSARRSLVSSLVGWSAPSFEKSEILSKAGAAPPTATRASAEVPAPPSNHMGAPAETEAANHLVRHGHEIVERNWKTKYCEIDIVSVKGDTVYFTEVKYRRTPWQGGGLAAITPKKLNQMRFAAKLYAQHQKMSDTNMRLAAIKSPTSAAMPSVITGRLKLVIIIRQSTEIRQLHTVDVILEALSAAMVRMTAKFALSRPCLFREYLASPSNKESSLSVVAITLALDIALHTPIIAAYIDAISIRSGLNTASPAA